MKTIVTHNGRPIYTTKKDYIDWWRVGLSLEKHSSFVSNIDEYKRMPHDYISQMILGYDVVAWVWSEISRDWVSVKI